MLAGRAVRGEPVKILAAMACAVVMAFSSVCDARGGGSHSSGGSRASSHSSGHSSRSSTHAPRAKSASRPHASRSAPGVARNSLWKDRAQREGEGRFQAFAPVPVDWPPLRRMSGVCHRPCDATQARRRRCAEQHAVADDGRSEGERQMGVMRRLTMPLLLASVACAAAELPSQTDLKAAYCVAVLRDQVNGFSSSASRSSDIEVQKNTGCQCR